MIGQHEYRGYTIHVEPDNGPISPRDCENLGVMVCGGSRYTLGDIQVNSWGDLDMIVEPHERKGAVILPLYLLDHSGLSLNTTGFNDPWDSRWIGCIYSTREEILRQTGWKYITQARRRLVVDALREEVRVYEKYLNGSLYLFWVEHDQWDVPDGYGMLETPEEALEEGKAIVDQVIQQKETYE